MVSAVLSTPILYVLFASPDFTELIVLPAHRSKIARPSCVLLTLTKSVLSAILGILWWAPLCAMLAVTSLWQELRSVMPPTPPLARIALAMPDFIPPEIRNALGVPQFPIATLD